MVLYNYSLAWQYIFKCFDLDIKSNIEIDMGDLMQPNSKITKAIMFIY
jgi:hypothetical protein